MKRGSDVFRYQHVGHGFYAEVTVDVAIDPKSQTAHVQFADNCGMEFRSAAVFGIEYAWEQYLQGRTVGRGLQAHVIDIGWETVDTTSVLVAYAAVRATWAALEWKPIKGPYFDETLASIIFPKSVRG